MLAVRIPEESEQRLSHLAAETGRSKAFYVREAIERYLEEMEDVYLAERSLEKVRAGEKTFSLAEIKARHLAE